MKERRNISDGDLIFPAIALSKECAAQVDDTTKLRKLEDVGLLIEKKGAILVTSQDNLNFFKETFLENKNNKMVNQIRELIKQSMKRNQFWINNDLPSFLDDNLQNLIVFDGLNTVLINVDKISKQSSILKFYNSSVDTKIQLLSLNDSFVNIDLKFEKGFQKGDSFMNALVNFEILIKWASSITIIDSYAIKNHKSIKDYPKDHKNMESGLENFLSYISDVLNRENKKLNRLRFISWSGKTSGNTSFVKDWKTAFNKLIEECGIVNKIKNHEPDNPSGYGIQLGFSSSHNHDRFIVFENNGLQLVYKCGKGLETLNSKLKGGEKTLINNFTIIGPLKSSEYENTKEKQIRDIIMRKEGEFYCYPFNSKN